jgi:hypothetical protein
MVAGTPAGRLESDIQAAAAERLYCLIPDVVDYSQLLIIVGAVESIANTADKRLLCDFF